MARHAIVEPDLLPFWNRVREWLVTEYGQQGKRNREITRRRASLAQELGLQDVTVRSFLNGSQKTLGENPRRRLCAKRPEIAELYQECSALESSDPISSITESLASPAQQALPFQLSLEFEGFDSLDKSLTLKLPPGRQGVISVRFKAG